MVIALQGVPSPSLHLARPPAALPGLQHEVKAQATIPQATPEGERKRPGLRELGSRGPLRCGEGLRTAPSSIPNDRAVSTSAARGRNREPAPTATRIPVTEGTRGLSMGRTTGTTVLFRMNYCSLKCRCDIQSNSMFLKSLFA